MKSNKVCAIVGNITDYKNGLGGLVENRPLATLPFGGKYRLIDFQLSAVANAGIRSVYAVFKHNEMRSVFDHIGSGKEWGLDTLLNRYFLGFYEELEEMQCKGENYYAAMIDYLVKSKSDQTVFMSSNILANVDLRQILQVHKNNGKNLTVAYKKFAPADLNGSNIVLELDESNHVKNAHNFKRDIDTSERVNLNMGIYIIDTQWLISSLREAYKTNLPPTLQSWLAEKLQTEETLAYEYTGYVSNIFDVSSYYNANMDLLDPATFNALFFSSNKVYTKVKNEAPTYYASSSNVKNSQSGSGSIIEGDVENSVLSRNIRVKKGAKVSNSILMPSVKIEENAIVENAIIDKNVIIESGAVVRGTNEKPVVITKGTVVSALVDSLIVE
ncbi:glucose-1-phosphate adenylyltransferase [Pilibacter termitis]|uniref:Glucose-1-phosphate adenylyltransferase n=1 Tax=Pilibacter termitis TaxID=263852 RepID=A0A1T4NQW3_9ENTE|nr:glucose-1-phosphate adenylyltransferase subunit GlgD [Pilibacter termitis]SJZ81582.1 glucose-1-phosphate adenylyltransferase [Pilibacter termitis]